MAINNVRILGRKYAVVSKDIEGLFGRCDNAKAVITVCEDQDAHSAKDTLLHEIMHAVLHQQGYDNPYKEEERYVRPLATGILTVLLENPALVKYLTEKDKT